MIYNRNKGIGDAGEYLVGYQLSFYHNWIYRKSTIDIGIDGEIEMIEEEKSTGILIKTQVKSTDDSDFKSMSVYQIAEVHINYWQQLNIPVILCRVFLKSQKIYCLPIDANLTFKKSKSEGMVNIDFSKSILLSDVTFKENINQYAKKYYAMNQDKIESLMLKLSDKINIIPEYNNPALFIDSKMWLEQIEEAEEDLKSIEKTLNTLHLNSNDIEETLKGYHRKLGTSKRNLIIDLLDS